MTKKATKATAKTFPDIIYVRSERDGGESYFLADAEVTGEDGTMVAIYTLAWIKHIKHTIDLQ